MFCSWEIVQTKTSACTSTRRQEKQKQKTKQWKKNGRCPVRYTFHNNCTVEIFSPTLLPPFPHPLFLGYVSANLRVFAYILTWLCDMHVAKPWRLNSNCRFKKSQCCLYSWFSRDVTNFQCSKPDLQKFYLHLRKDFLQIYIFTIP